ncbi:MAG: DUF2442 domain-containing protein [Candidatus Scalindua rubra]|uniref:DUF2442 domain-containing protein n=1 Tax=Candidatus Scalindua brodae TaxID=237368 RepID=A0A0B0EGH0_9BACT|nr:MAG: hypothetical protein SCABRO_02077 [Candidatus Scalindua brodae]MBZ0107295.1 DUF2442 domain-containing protein [Candidatus Scalindua rubra]TWU32080.1 hypothetical protein S225a_18440 [Candidatus Brocadiaceae bacterium S225]
MFLHVTDAKYIKDYTIWVEFNDMTSGNVDLSSELDDGVFKPLQDVDYFKNFKIRGHTLSWDSGADFAPEFLHEKARLTKSCT